MWFCKHPQIVYTWGAVLWATIQDKPMVYEQEDVADAIAWTWFDAKNMIPSNPQIETDKPQIGKLVSSITILYIWKA